MRVYTKAVSKWDDELGRYVTDEQASVWFEYEGEVEQCKGGDVANQQRQEELNMQKAAIARQNQQQDYVKGLVKQFVEGQGQGFDPAQLALLQTQFLNSNDAAYNSASKSLSSALLARGAGGGNLPVSGDTVRGYLGLRSARAGSQAQGMQNIGLQDLQTAINNRWNALSILNGQPAQLNTQIGSSAEAATGALKAYVEAQNSGFLSSFGQALGSGIGKMAVGGLSGGLNSLTGTNWFGGSGGGK